MSDELLRWTTPSSLIAHPSSLVPAPHVPCSAVFEEPQQFALVGYRGRDREVIDRGGAEAAHEGLAALRCAAGDVGAAEVDEAGFAGLEVDQARKPARGEALLARVDDRDGDHVVLAVEAVQRALEREVEEVGYDEHHRALDG